MKNRERFFGNIAQLHPLLPQNNAAELYIFCYGSQFKEIVRTGLASKGVRLSNVNLAECLAFAAEQRFLAEQTTLENVREQYLRSARRWERIASELGYLIQIRPLQNSTWQWFPSNVNGTGMNHGEKMTPERRSEVAREAAIRRWNK